MSWIRRAALGAALATFAATVVAPVQAAQATSAPSGQWLYWNDDGSTSATFGAGESIVISDGRIAYVNDCLMLTGSDEYSNDFMHAATDVYIVEAGSVDDGSELEDASGGDPNTIQSAGAGGYFIDELIGTTASKVQVGNPVPEGTYDVVYDECQDGTFQSSHDAVFTDAITVDHEGLPIPTWPSGSLVAQKLGAEIAKELLEEYHDWLEGVFDAGYAAAGTLNPMVKFVKAAGTHTFIADPGAVALLHTANLAKHYAGIAADPPDPDFDQVTALEPTAQVDPFSTAPLPVAQAALATATSTEAALAEALLHAMERYQGAEEDEDSRWALAHARSIQDLSAALADAIGDRAALLDDLVDAVEAMPASELEAAAAELDAFVDRVRTSGFDDDDRRIARNLGLDDAAIEDLEEEIAERDYSDFTVQEAIDAIEALEADSVELADAMAGFGDVFDPIVDQLHADQTVPEPAPLPDAGGPYTGAVGTPVAFDATATTNPPGGSLTYAWDLDGDGDFDDATGATPSFTYERPYAGLVAVRAANGLGDAVAYAPLTVTASNGRPSLGAVSPAADPSLRVGDAQTFSIAPADPESDPLTVRWLVDGAVVPGETANTFDYEPTSSDIGVHAVTAVVDDAPAGGGASQRSWQVTVEDVDGDADGWNANVDCDDANAAVPADAEVVGNGADDDCDPATPDTGSPPDASFVASVQPGLVLQLTDTSTDANDDITSWEWDFGDGATSTEQHPSHTYDEKGTKTVSLTVTDATGAEDTVTEDVVVASPPVASFTHVPAQPVAGGEVDFTDTSTDPDGTVVDREWDFGDGATSDERHPSHTFEEAGTYDVSLTVTDDEGAVGTTTVEVTVVDADPTTGPVAAFRPQVPGRDVAAIANGGVIVSSSGQCCGGHEPAVMLDDVPGWPWATNGLSGHFVTIRIATTPRQIDAVQVEPRSDGWFEQRVRQFAIDVSTTGTAAGDFTQVLTATTADSGALQTFPLPAGTRASYVRYRPLTSNGSCCHISTTRFKVMSASTGPRTVTFQNDSTGATSYRWDFGDGDTSTQATPTHTYDVPGVYTVTLRAKAADGRVNTVTRSYEVRGPTADFSVEPGTPEPGVPAVLTDTSTYHSAPGTTYAWDFGDGTPAHSWASTLHTFATAGTYTVRLTVTDAEGNSDTVTKTVEVAARGDDEPPTAYFAPTSAAEDVAAAANGASITSSSGQYSASYPTSTLIDADPNNSYWATPSGTSTGRVDIDLAGSTPRLIDRVRIAGRGGAERVRGFEVWVSTTGTADADFTKVYAGTNPNSDALVEHGLPAAVAASHVRLRLLSNHGSGCCIGVASFQVWTGPESAGRNLALAEDGATVLASSGQYSSSYPASSLIDGNPANNAWLTPNQVTSGWATITLAGGGPRMIDQVRIQPRDASHKVRAFEIALSSTGTADRDFVTVLVAQAADNESLQRFRLPHPMPAKHVRYRALTTRGGTSFNSTGDLRVDTVQESTSRTVRFTNLARGATSYHWDFGDGETSTAASPVHTFPGPGTYPVTLTATNDAGSATFTLEQVVRGRSFELTPNAPEVHQRIAFRDTSPAELGLRSFTWDFGDGTTSALRNPLKTYAAPGTYLVTSTATDREGTLHTTSREVVVAQSALRAEFRPVGTFNMGALENGATVVEFSSQYDCCSWNATKLIDAYPNTAWHTNNSTTGHVTFSLAGGQTYQVDRFELLGRQDCCYDQHPQHFEIDVSTTGTAPGDFVTVLQGTLDANRTTPQTFLLPRPVDAKHIRYRALTNRGSSVVTTAMLRVIGGQVNDATVSFDDLSYGGTAPYTYAWDFGDGTTSTDAAPAHTFPGPGTYPVTLTVTDATGAVATRTMQQRVLAVPVASFTNNPVTPNEVQSTTFTDTTPAPAGSAIIERRWTWADGTADSVTTAATQAHTFADSGTYQVALAVRDAWGQSASVVRPVTVANVAPTVEAGLGWRWRSGRALRLTPTTADVAGSRDPITCTWSWGDGTPDGTACAFDHTYGSAGTYTATVTVNDGDGGTATDSITIDVLEPKAPPSPTSPSTGTGAGLVSDDHTYTVNDDFQLGTMLNVNHDAVADQLRLNTEATPFPFVYIAISGRGTAVRIDVETGEIVGEYKTAPDNRAKNPSRTTVDKLGNVWVTNRDESEFRTIDGLATNWGSTTRIGLLVGGTRVNASGVPTATGEYLKAPFEYNTCVDRDGDGLIRTSRGLGNVLAWANASGVDHDGGVDTAADECIQLYVRVRGINTRTVAIDAENDAWIGGANNWHEEVDGDTGKRVPGTAFSLGCGGYGGLIDRNGVLWSARYGSGLLRYDTRTRTGVCLGNSHGDYGLGVDPVAGNIWHTTLNGNRVMKLNPAATTQATIEIARYYHGNNDAQGVAVDSRGSVWVAHALYGAPHIGRITTGGQYLGRAALGPGSSAAGPTGVAVDANGNVWSANHITSNVSRIDPEIGTLEPGATAPSGWYDLVVSLGPGASPYNYSDMTGAVALGAASPSGFWTIKQEGSEPGTVWRAIDVNGETPAGTSIVVEARAADTQAELGALPFRPVTNGDALDGIVGRFIEVRATLQTTDSASTPVLHDIRISANRPPVASDSTVTVPEDEPTDVSLVATDPDGDELAYEIVDQPAHGTVVVDGSTATYSPDPGYSGPDSFTWRARDERVASNTATVAITVTGVNDPPVASDVDATTDEDTPVAVELSGSDADGDDLMFEVTSGPSHGSYADGTYTPAPDFHGEDAFTFTASEGNGGTDTGVVAITVLPVNDAPVVTDSSVTTDEDTSVAVPLTGTDVDGDALTFEVTSGPSHGSYLDGVYTPLADYHGTDGFTFTASDGNGGVATGVVSITVLPVNDAPLAEDVSVATDEDTPVPVPLSADDPDGDALVFTVTSGPAHGTFADGVYTPAADFFGEDTFEYVADDGRGGVDTGVVTITVRPVNDAPVATDAGVVTDEDTPVAVVLAGIDPDGDPLEITVTSPPAHGAFADGVYTPEVDFHGEDVLAFSVDDGNGGVDEGTVTITVLSVNDVPVATPDGYSVGEDAVLALGAPGVLLNDRDPDGEPLTAQLVTGPSHGTLVLGGDGSVRYTPAADYTGPDSFTYRATDGTDVSDVVTVTIDVVAAPLIATKVALDPLLVRVLPTTVYLKFGGRLLERDSGAAVVGRSLQFSAYGKPACSAVTDANGYATCELTIPRLLWSVLDLGYRGAFAGDHDFSASSGRGSLFTLM